MMMMAYKVQGSLIGMTKKTRSYDDGSSTLSKAHFVGTHIPRDTNTRVVFS